MCPQRIYEHFSKPQDLFQAQAQTPGIFKEFLKFFKESPGEANFTSIFAPKFHRHFEVTPVPKNSLGTSHMHCTESTVHRYPNSKYVPNSPGDSASKKPEATQYLPNPQNCKGGQISVFIRQVPKNSQKRPIFHTKKVVKTNTSITDRMPK